MIAPTTGLVTYNTAVVGDDCVELQYMDSGPVPGSDVYTTVVLLHGTLFNGSKHIVYLIVVLFDIITYIDVYSKLLPLMENVSSLTASDASLDTYQSLALTTSSSNPITGTTLMHVVCTSALAWTSSPAHAESDFSDGYLPTTHSLKQGLPSYHLCRRTS